MREILLLDRRSCSIVRLAAWRSGGGHAGASPLHRLCSWQGHVKTQRRSVEREIARASRLELSRSGVPGAARPLTYAC